eukprot:TRINITY_DN11620_c0_g9_i1.p1 TRINITY_DN11620_c0_g9~~TRINITY_DN11620_c0_g9_i1.p1  ORF type:complete len:123 (-),score=24.69 TRINITY_DN11620_c0_g9_i1:56-391(-)
MSDQNSTFQWEALPRVLLGHEAERCRKQLKEIGRCDSNVSRRTSKMCKMAEQSWLECAGRSRCPVEHAAFSRCWASFINSGAYVDPTTRVATASCDGYLDILRLCVHDAAR